MMSMKRGAGCSGRMLVFVLLMTLGGVRQVAAGLGPRPSGSTGVSPLTLLPAAPLPGVLLPPVTPLGGTVPLRTSAVAGATALAGSSPGATGTIAVTTSTLSTSSIPSQRSKPLISSTQGSATVSGVGGILRAGGLSSSQSGQGQASGFQTTGIAVDVAGASSGALQSSAAVLGQPRGSGNLLSESRADFKSKEGPVSASGSLVNQATTGK